MNNSCINEKSKFTGDLKSKGNAVISGVFQGSLNANNTVKIEATGKVEGNISSNIIFVFGKVEGNLKAEKAVILKDNCLVNGDITTPSIIIEERSSHSGKLILE